MRILVASERIGTLSAGEASRLVAAAWPHADTLVVPMGEAGRGFVEAYADLLGGVVETAAGPAGLLTEATVGEAVAIAVQAGDLADDPQPYQATSVLLGEALLRAVRGRPRRILVDLTGLPVHDAGAGVFAALGAVADVPLDRGAESLGALTSMDVQPVRTLLDRIDLVGVVPDAERMSLLLGLRGITSLKGRPAGIESELLLAIDAGLERFAQLADPASANAPGSGACGGLGFTVLALGGRLTTGPRLALETAPPRRGLDLVVTGCEVFDFASRGGGVVAESARVAEEALCPCVALAGEVMIGSRERRTMGVESAYAVREGGSGFGPITGSELAALARRVARSWSW